MSRFVPEGESDLKSLQSKEHEASKRFQDEQEEQETLSLYDQMRLNHIAKEQEFEEKVKAKNRSHILNEKEIEFYNTLDQKRDAKLQSRKDEIENGLRSFEVSKRNKVTKPDTKKTADIELITKNVIKKKQVLKAVVVKKPNAVNKLAEEKKLEPTEKKSIVGNYDSSDSDSE